MNGYFEEINKSKYLTLVSTNQREKHKKNEELWSKIRDLIKSLTTNSNDYDENCMRIKFNSDDELPLNKTIEIPSMTIVFGVVFHENKKYYSQVFLDERLYILLIIYKGYILIELMFLKELMLVRQRNQKNVNKDFNFQSRVCNGCHDLLMISMNLSCIAILNIKVSDYHCIIRKINKSEAINVVQNTNLTEKSRTL